MQYSQLPKRINLFVPGAIALLFVTLCVSTTLAQSGSVAPAETATQANQKFTRPTFGKPAAPVAQQPWKFEGRLHLQEGSTEGYIVLQIDLAPGHYMYSVSPEGSPAPTKIEIVPSASIQVAQEFSPDQPPTVIENDPVFQRRIEKHTDRVQFFVPCRLDPNADYKLTGLPVIEFNGQVCSKDGVCLPIRNKKIEVKFAGYFQQDSAGEMSSNQEQENETSSQANAAGIPANPHR